jgi:signal peptidase I
VPFRYSTVLVEGDSMLPTYSSGDWLLARWGSFSLRNGSARLLGIFSGGFRSGGLSVDDVVTIELPDRPGIFYVKRVSKIDYDLQVVYLLSDNPEGTDSRQWGWIALDAVKAKVLLRVRSSKER